MEENKAEFDVLDAIESCEAATPEKVCITYGEQKVTYASLGKRVREIACSLSEILPQEERAVIIFPMGIEYVMTFLAIEYVGGLPCPCYPSEESPSFTARFQEIVRNSKAAVIVTTEVEKKKMEEIDELKNVIKNMTWVLFDNLERKGTFNRIEKSKYAFIQYSSGTTSTPKGVLVSHENLMKNINAFEKMIVQVGEDEISAVSWMPLYHDMGLIAGLLLYLANGHTIHLLSIKEVMKNPLIWLQKITEYKASVTLAPNFAFDMCVKEISEEELENLDLSSLKLIINGAEQISEQSLQQFEEKFRKTGYRLEAMCPCYGLAEATLLVTNSDVCEKPVVSYFDKNALSHGVVCVVPKDSSSALSIVSCGSVIEDMQVEVVDLEKGTRKGPNQVGELWVHGTSVACGYYGKEELTQESFKRQLNGETDTYLRTGDQGFFYQDNLYLCGRLKEVIVINGANYNPCDLEKEVKSILDNVEIGNVVFVSVIEEGVEKVLSVIEIISVSAKNNIKEYVKKHILEKFNIVLADVILVPNGTIQLTESGKVKRNLCKDMYLKQQLKGLGESL